MKKTFLRLSLAGLFLLTLLIVYIEFISVPVRHFKSPLNDIVPAALPGWDVRDVPLAQTQGALEQVNNVLQFDDFSQRLYKKGDLEIIVYAAYWTPGKVTTADAGTHNPDSCWVLAGWTRKSRDYSVPTRVGDLKLLPAECGVYSINNHTSYVEFWHLVNGLPNRYENQQTGWRTGFAGRIERLPLVLEDMRKYGINMKREQLFVRISANKPFARFQDDPDFVLLMKSMAGLGIVDGAGWGGNAPGAARVAPKTNDTPGV